MSGMTKIQFYGGYETPGKFFWEDLYKSFKNSRKAYIFTYAFGKTDGLIEEGIAGKEFIRLLVDEGGFVDSSSLQNVFRLSKKYNDTFEIKLNRANKLFHPKLYFFTNGSKKTVFLGSSNFTDAGLTENIEANVRLTGLDKTTIKKIEQFCENVWKGADPLTEPLFEKLKKGLKKRQKSGNDEGRRPKGSSEDRYNLPPCPPLSKLIKPSRIERRRKRSVVHAEPINEKSAQNLLAPEEFKKQLKKRLPPSFKSMFPHCKITPKEKRINISERKGQRQFQYKLWYCPNEQDKPYRVTIWCGETSQTKNFVDYLNLKDGEAQRSFQTKLSNLGSNFELRIIDRRKKNPEDNDVKSVSDFVNMVKKINKGNKRFAAFYVFSKKDVPSRLSSISKAVDQLKQLMSVYNFIKEGINEGRNG